MVCKVTIFFRIFQGNALNYFNCLVIFALFYVYTCHCFGQNSCPDIVLEGFVDVWCATFGKVANLESAFVVGEEIVDDVLSVHWGGLSLGGGSLLLHLHKVCHIVLGGIDGMLW